MPQDIFSFIVSDEALKDLQAKGRVTVKVCLGCLRDEILGRGAIILRDAERDFEEPLDAPRLANGKRTKHPGCGSRVRHEVNILEYRDVEEIQTLLEVELIEPTARAREAV